ncbi:MAG: hypothetical protein ABI867_11870 [Kofleriaceae bacterium]
MRWLVVLLIACGATAPRPSFNDRIVELIETYPAHGYGGYAWPSRDGGAGTTRDLRIGSEVIARGGDGNHCVGVTLEVYWRALEACDGGVAGVFDADAARAFRKQWYVPEIGGAGAVDALVARGLGDEIALADARPGDFVQAWNHDSTIGHSMVFLGWDREESKIRYWSSQPWTEGIGVSEMPLGDTGWDPARTRIVRARCR